MENLNSSSQHGLTLPRAAAILAINLIYSLSAVVSKYAARSEPFSLRFFIFLALLFLTLFIYAVSWQQLIKRVPLSTAYPFKGVVVVYNLLWAALLFGERISAANVAGACIILAGVYMVGQND